MTDINELIALARYWVGNNGDVDDTDSDDLFDRLLSLTGDLADALAAHQAALGPDVRAMQWKQLEAALFSLTNAQFEYENASGRPFPEEHLEAGRMHVEDCRRALGALALTLADGPDAEGYARLLDPVTGGE